MDVTFTPEQDALRDAVRSLLADHCPSEHVRQVMESDTGADLDLYRRLIELGTAELPGLVELLVVMEECGRALVPAPVVTSIGVAAPALAASAPDHPLLDAVRSGEAILALADEPSHMAEAHVATHVAFVKGDELHVADAGACRIEVLPTMDPTRRLCAVGVPDDTTAVGPAEPALAALWTQGAVAVAAELVGVAQACLEMTTEHAKQREQFGKPIGVYQAVSHRIVDMFIITELARSHVYYGAWAVQDGIEQAMLAAAQAKAAAGEAAVTSAQSAIQVHGGVGFTWEHDLHLYLKRARSGAALLGTPGAQRQRIAELMLA